MSMYNHWDDASHTREDTETRMVELGLELPEPGDNVFDVIWGILDTLEELQNELQAQGSASDTEP